MLNVRIASVCVLVLLAACNQQEQNEQSAATDPPASPAVEFADGEWAGGNCLIIVLDALTVRHLSLWGYERETTPNINAFAERGIVFKTARAQASSTLPSVYSYFTGKNAPLLLLPEPPLFSAPAHLPDDEFTIAEAFREAGYDTYALSANMNVSDILGFDQGFDQFDYVPRYSALDPDTGDVVDNLDPNRLQEFVDLDVTSNDAATDEILDRARDWIADREVPWLCYIHLLRPHNPYRAPDPLGRAYAKEYDGNVDGSDAYWERVAWKPPRADMARLKDFYDGNIRYVDEKVGALLQDLADKGAIENTAVIFMSDHGEAFMEHGYSLHSASVHEELLHVPLIVVPPGGRTTQPAIVERETQLIDLFPTFAKLFDLEAPADLPGMSLGAADARPLFAQNMPGDIACVIYEEKKLIAQFDESEKQFVPREVYDLRKDPLEQTNLLQRIRPKELEALLTRLQTFTATHTYEATDDPVQLRGFDLKVLESLGYT